MPAAPPRVQPQISEFRARRCALTDLLSPPGNGLEALRGDLKGLHSIRVNDQWRIVFRWTADGPDQVDVVDYHS